LKLQNPFKEKISRPFHTTVREVTFGGKAVSNTINSSLKNDQKCYPTSDRVYVLKSIFGHILFNGTSQYIWSMMELKPKRV